jgi:hypothetical protein
MDGETVFVYIAQGDTDSDDREWFHENPEFVLVDGAETHLWADGRHFVTDPDGEIRPGQWWLMRDPGVGIFLHEITAVDSATETAEVQHRLHWMDGQVERTEQTETFEWDVITGEYDRAMGDSSTTEFIQAA